MLVIVADDRIPYVTELFAPYGKIIQIPGSQIQSKDLKQADVLLTRTVTSVDASLLQDTDLSFIGTATAGHDHIDEKILEEKKIAWAYAPGANADAVAEYVLHGIAYLQHQGLLSENSRRAGIIGVGEVGSRLTRLLSSVGFKTVLYDPPRAQRASDFYSVSLEEVQKADVISIQTSLTREGHFPSYHLIDARFLNQMPNSTILFNVGRGAVLDNNAASESQRGGRGIFCLDVWEDEPRIHRELLMQAAIATPHIAGYSRLSKWRTIYAIYQSFLKHFQYHDHAHWKKLPILHEKFEIDISDCKTWESVLLRIYNPNVDGIKMRNLVLSDIEKRDYNFEKLRRDYELRPEFSQVIFTTEPHAELKIILKSLGFLFGH